MVGVDGLRSGRNIAGGPLWEVRVHGVLGVWRGSSFLMLKSFVIVCADVRLEEQEKSADSI